MKGFPRKKYSVIYADPPWMENKRNNPNTKFGGGSGGHYPLMTTSDLMELPVPRITADNCALLLWATFPHLPKALELMERWGFKYRTLGFSWIKTNKVNKKPCFGIGYYAKSNAEVCLLGVKGKMKPVSNKVSSCIIAPRGGHSAKPLIVRDKIVELFGDVPRIELFARTKSPGWDVWGNQL